MRLFLHNHLLDEDGMPYSIQNAKARLVAKDFDLVQTIGFLKTIDMKILKKACEDIGVEFKTMQKENAPQEEELQALHHILFEIEIVQGKLVSSKGEQYIIVAGVPDLEKPILSN